MYLKVILKVFMYILNQNELVYYDINAKMCCFLCVAKLLDLRRTHVGDWRIHINAINVTSHLGAPVFDNWKHNI